MHYSRHWLTASVAYLTTFTSSIRVNQWPIVSPCLFGQFVKN